ncbi:ABC transporter ATP-binding protein [Pelagibacterium lacus]|uniref:ABC transporter ATP-binding protein n=1 Tax=Pelagibacterium lacus TaxID=2282655 RepID=A0A369W3H8_9HYPH|nr:ABC transporter ATP-binding protein [Pelagibacterium lacus]RDE08893.1 ABC transporter ATP-binding protein [Pelagibacterium lacus]
MAFLELRDLHKSIGGLDILKGIDITLEKGGFLVLVGPSGCGKSTLLNTVAGLTPVTSGEIVIDGEIVNDLHPSKRDIAMVFQSYALYPNMTVEGNIAFALEMRGVPRPEREAAVAKAARTLQIEHLLKRRPSQLSGGQRQRVAMGRALVRDPLVFLFDEPLSNLDAKLRVEMRAEIKRLHRDTGATIVYVTHDQIEAMTMATKIAVLKDGVLQQVGTPDEIYRVPANLFVADFMGSPAMNLLRGTVSADRSAIELDGSEPVRLALPPTVSREKLAGGQNVILGIRPEAITDESLRDPAAGVVTTLELPVDLVEPTGSDTYVVAPLAGTEITARMRAQSGVAPGRSFGFVFNLDKAVVFEPETTQRID